MSLEWFWQWWNWLWSEAGGAWVAAAVATAAGYFAFKSWRAGEEAIRASFRPVLRPIPTYQKGQLEPDSFVFLLKNYGKGPAVGVRLIGKRGDDNDSLLMTADIVEPLGPREDGKEWKRTGRLKVRSLVALEPDENYRLLYQDLDGCWHETTFTPTGVGFEIRYLGTRRAPDLPAHVVRTGSVIYGEEEPPA